MYITNGKSKMYKYAPPKIAAIAESALGKEGWVPSRFRMLMYLLIYGMCAGRLLYVKYLSGNVTKRLITHPLTDMYIVSNAADFNLMSNCDRFGSV